MSFKARFLFLITAILLIQMIGVIAASAQVLSSTIIIDSTTVQPIACGIPVVAVGDAYIVLAEGAIQRFPDTSRYTEGWINPNGETRLNRGGELTQDMPYGALGQSWASFSTNLHFVGSQGVIVVSGALAPGSQMYLALNMSNADLASSTGQIVVHIIYVPNGAANHAEILIDSTTSNPVPTGIFSGSAADKYIILPYGSLRRSNSDPYASGWFGPAGYASADIVGMPKASGPFGALMGSFNPTGSLTYGFYIQDGGSFTSGTSDIGNELYLGVNLPPGLLATCSGQFQVNVIQIPNPVLAATPDTPTRTKLGQAYPNPLNPSTTIEFGLDRSENVLLRVYDISGRWIRTLVDGSREAGEHQVKWDGIDNNGMQVASGTYLYQLSTSEGSQTGRVAVVK